jgi:preprotein translocase subunit SecA
MAVTVGKVLTKVFGSRNERLLKRYRRMVEQINVAEGKVLTMTDEGLRARTAELKAGITGGKIKIDDVLPEAFAIIRESMDRHIGIRSIFNPETKFDPDTLDDATLEAYDSVQRRMIETGESWLTVPIPQPVYAAIRKMYPESRPPYRARCFDVQLIGGLVLYEGKIAEMSTGEGKTFVAPLACFVRILEGLHCHVVTVNDYLVRRDAQWVTPAFNNLGMTVGFIQSDMEPGGDNRRKMYECDITYGTNSEFGFDFLRDNMKERVELQVQGPLDYAIVDEVDSILIDEARTPLIISGAAHDDAPKYRAADAVARKVMELHKPYAEVEKAVDTAKRAIKAAVGDEDKAKDKPAKEAARKRRGEAEKQLEEAEKKKEGVTQYYEVEMDRKTVHLTHEGIAAAQAAAGVGSFFVGENMEWSHLMENAMRAHVVYERDKDYVVERGPRGEMEVIIVDEFTGRKMVGRQWSDGLHQSVEAKEKVNIKEETQTLATITLQNFFKMYKKLAGMTGTAQTEAEEFGKIYRLDVVTIPTNRPVIRDDGHDRVFRTEREKWEAIIDEIKDVSQAGRPVLVGTTSVEKSEMVSNMLRRKHGIEHNVLNAKFHERESEIVADAGQQIKNAHGDDVGRVTIATNMAGRGTDIKLTPEAHKAGGLHVIGTERHTARRIDNQLRGRSGRQGDPGSSRFYVSLQDDLMAMFAGEWTIKVLSFLGMEEGQHIEDKRISKGILRAQKKVEERNYLARKNLLEYDEVMDHQRNTFYGMRQSVLRGQNVDQMIWDTIGDAIEDAVDKYITKDYVAAVIAEWARTNFEVQLEPASLKGYRNINDLEMFLKDQARAEADSNITTSVGEYMGEDEEDVSTWDIKGLSSWAMQRFHASLPVSQIKKMEPRELEDRLRDAAKEQINKRDVSGLLKYLEPMYAETELAGWAKDKFGVEVKPEEVLADARSSTRKPADEIVELIEKRAREAYARREIEYPVDHTLTFAFGGAEGNTDNPYAADYVRTWARMKYNVDLPVEAIRGQSVRKLRDQLIGLQEKFLVDGELQREVNAMVKSHPNPSDLVTAFNDRFGTKIKESDLNPATRNPATRNAGSGNATQAPADYLFGVARGMLRRELSDLEQFVLIQIFDQSWKDHLYAMDALKSGIGLQAFAEQDPRVAYKREGFEYFQQMMIGVRDKVTDLIFRARVVGPTQTRSAYRETAAVHESAGGYGVGENVQATAAAVEAPRPQSGATEPSTVKTIVRDQPKVGRNDPCPCGSGKKYKHCHGANAA